MIASRNKFLYSFVIFILFIVSMNHWIGWNYKTIWGVICASAFVIIRFLFKIKLYCSKRNIIACILLYINYLWGLGWRGNPISRVFFTQIFSELIPLIFIICLPALAKKEILNYISKWFAWMMFPAILLYLITRYIDIPPIGILQLQTKEIFMDKGYGHCYNYFFFVEPFFSSDGYQRFFGPFLEPGHLGTVCAFILFANLHNYKKRSNWILLISVVLSMSLAGYILTVIGFLFSRYYTKRMKPSNVIIYIIAVFSFVGLARNFNYGNNVFNQKILQRLESDEEKGFKGNNRASSFIDDLYKEMFKRPETLVLGYSEKEQKSFGDEFHGNGFKYFVVRKGFLGLLIGFLFYVYILLKSKDKKYAILFFAFVCICFWQRTYLTWFSWIICYEYAISVRDYTKMITKRNMQIKIKIN